MANKGLYLGAAVLAAMVINTPAMAWEPSKPVEIVVHHGGSHGWYTMVYDIRQFATWFDGHLRP